jgi:hypothetical protein
LRGHKIRPDAISIIAIGPTDLAILVLHLETYHLFLFHESSAPFVLYTIVFVDPFSRGQPHQSPVHLRVGQGVYQGLALVKQYGMTVLIDKILKFFHEVVEASVRGKVSFVLLKIEYTHY